MTGPQKIINHLLKPHIIINSKWITNLNIKVVTIKLLEEHFGNKVLDISPSNIFFDMSLQGRETKQRITNGTTANENVFVQQRKPSTQ